MNNKETIQHIIETTPNQRRNNKTNKVNPIHIIQRQTASET